MNWEHVEENWDQVKAVLGSSFGKLTPQDLERVSGTRRAIVELVRSRYGCAEEEAKRQTDEWARGLPSTDIKPEATR